MALEEPVGYAIEDVQALATEPAQARQDVVGELAEGMGQVTASIPLEPAPLALFLVQLGAVPSQREHMQPGRTLPQGCSGHLAAMR